MRIVLLFQFNGEREPSAVTGVEGEVTDLLLPSVGDVIEHRDAAGLAFRGRITDRIFKYEMPNAEFVLGGAISITLCMDRTTVH